MTITLTREEAQSVLDALEGGGWTVKDYAVELLRARLSAPEPEPVAFHKDAPERIYLQVCDDSDCDEPFCEHHDVSWCQDKINNSDVEYIRADPAPPQREWQGLTDDEIKDILDCGRSNLVNIKKAEQKLKEKNT